MNNPRQNQNNAGVLRIYFNSWVVWTVIQFGSFVKARKSFGSVRDVFCTNKSN